MAVLDRLFASVYDRVLAPSEVRGLAQMREELVAPLSGTVVEIGAGTGLNLVHYPRDLDRLMLCEPTPEMVEHLEARVADVGGGAGVGRRLEVVGAPAEAIPMPDDSVDHVVSTLVLCTVDDVARSVAEIARVLRPGGTLHLIEHIVAEPGRMRTVQTAIEPVWTVVARGCRLRRDPRTDLQEHGFRVSDLEEISLPGGAGPVRRAIRGRAPLVA